MRRIIERTVTVVTTTTWTISWQDDAHHASSDPQPDSVTDNIPKSDVSRATAKHIQKISPVTQTKEVDVSETEKVIDQTADEPPDDPYFYQSKKGNAKL